MSAVFSDGDSRKRYDHHGSAGRDDRTMIEFKAECGHTVRAKDEDAGGLVRCSYCGRPANVPEGAGDDLDFLFSDVEQADDVGSSRKRKRSKGRLLARRKRRPGEFNPFAVVLRLCYGALLIVIVIIVGRMFVMPLFKGEGLGGRPNFFSPPGPVKPDPPEPRKREPVKPGLIARKNLIGLYVNSTPPGAKVYCVPASKAPEQGRVHKAKGVIELQVGESYKRLADGEYVVEVVFAWNDQPLTVYDGYLDFRRSFHPASDDERDDLIKEYFVPDEGIMFVDETEEQIYLVKQYRNVEVVNKQSDGVRALFLPRILQADGRSLSIEELVTRHTPEEPAYSFDRRYVSDELRFNGVKETDLSFVLEGLSRIGVIPYVTADRRTLLFKIHIRDGRFTVRGVGGRRR